jgi:hypothetical protein
MGRSHGVRCSVTRVVGTTVWPASSLPLRSMLALAVIAVLAMLILWMVVLVARSRPRSRIARVLLIGASLVLTAVALWIIFVLPTYWD